jgi:hypothetical protein
MLLRHLGRGEGKYLSYTCLALRTARAGLFSFFSSFVRDQRQTLDAFILLYSNNRSYNDSE